MTIDHWKGLIGLSLAALIWGSTYVVIKGLLETIGPFTIAVLRLALASVVLLPFGFRAALRLRHLRVARFWAFGLTGVGLYFGLLTMGLVYTSAGSVALIAGATPVATAALAVVCLRERPSARQWVGMTVSMAGIVLVVGSGFELGNWRAVFGNILVLGSTVAWAAYTVQGRRMASTDPASISTFASLMTGMLLLAPFCVLELATQGVPAFSGGTVLALLYLGLGGSALAYGLWNTALRFVSASEAGPFINLIPVVGLAFALAVGEPVVAVQLLGGAVTLVGVVLAQGGAHVAPTVPHSHRDSRHT